MKKETKVVFDHVLYGQSLFEQESEKLSPNAKINFDVRRKCVSIQEEKGQEAKRRKKKPDVEHSYYFKGGYNKKGKLTKGAIVLNLSFHGGDKRKLTMNLNFDPRDPVDISVGKVLSRIRSELTPIIANEFSEKSEALF